MAQKTCFVIMGFGIKTDYRTGRNLDLDKTYFNVVKPVFEELGYLCFRADEIKHAGIIDIPMYENILKADFVVADISTLNPNAIYELGVRHAAKNRTTIIISEKELTMPFDLNRIVIYKYEHMGTDLGFNEVGRFRQLLKDLVIKLQTSDDPDSPLYSFLPEYNGPSYTKQEIREIKQALKEEVSLADELKKAEQAKDDKNFLEAIEILKPLKEKCPSNEFIVQRLALNTYKSKDPSEQKALENALEILKELNPQLTTNPETLALNGAIYKRLNEITGDVEQLRESLWSYERGFYIKQDYYNGINAAFLHTLNAVKETDPLKAQASYAQGISVRHHVIRICAKLTADREAFRARDDQQWIYFTLAEAHLGIDDEEKEKKYFSAAELIASTFDMDSYLTQKAKLVANIRSYKEKYAK